MLAFIRKILFSVMLGALVVFAYQNLEALSTPVHFRFDLYFAGWQFAAPELPVVFLLVVCFLAGLLSAGFQAVYERFVRGADLRRRDKRIRELEKEVVALKSQVPAAPTEAPAEAVLELEAPAAQSAPPSAPRRRWGTKPATPPAEPPTL